MYPVKEARGDGGGGIHTCVHTYTYKHTYKHTTPSPSPSPSPSEPGGREFHFHGRQSSDVFHPEKQQLRGSSLRIFSVFHHTKLLIQVKEFMCLFICFIRLRQAFCSNDRCLN